MGWRHWRIFEESKDVIIGASIRQPPEDRRLRSDLHMQVQVLRLPIFFNTTCLPDRGHESSPCTFMLPREGGVLAVADCDMGASRPPMPSPVAVGEAPGKEGELRGDDQGDRRGGGKEALDRRGAQCLAASRGYPSAKTKCPHSTTGRPEPKGALGVSHSMKLCLTATAGDAFGFLGEDMCVLLQPHGSR